MALKVGIISDTHGYFDDAIAGYLAECDEIWHAGDFGNIETLDRYRALAPMVGVYGNIDGHEVRQDVPLHTCFEREGLHIWMTHIGGRPGKYSAEVREKVRQYAYVDIFVCGHSHILMVKRDATMGWLYINPGAAGKTGFHKSRTLMLLKLESGKVHDAHVVELGKRFD